MFGKNNDVDFFSTEWETMAREGPRSQKSAHEEFENYPKLRTKKERSSTRTHMKTYWEAFENTGLCGAWLRMQIHPSSHPVTYQTEERYMQQKKRKLEKKKFKEIEKRAGYRRHLRVASPMTNREDAERLLQCDGKLAKENNSWFNIHF